MANIDCRGNNTWRIRVSRTDPLTKKSVRRAINVKGSYKTATDKELVRIANKFESEIDSGIITSGNNYITLFEHTKTYFIENASTDLSQKTIKGYKDHLNSHILPYLGSFNLKDITPIVISKYYSLLMTLTNKKTGQPLSDKTIKNIIQVLSRMLTQAVYWQLIDINPCTRIKKPKSRGIKREPRFYDTEQVTSLIHALDSLEGSELKWKVTIYLVLFMGFRRGEVSGLMNRDIDLNSHSITLSQSRIYVSGEGIIEKSTKTNISKKSKSMPLILSDILSQYISYKEKQRNDMGEVWADSPYLIVNDYGEPLHPESYSTWFKRFIIRNNLPPLSFHELRHTHATILLESGISMKAIQDRLDHTRYQTTADIYSHVVKSTDRNIADKLDDIFSNKINFEIKI